MFNDYCAAGILNLSKKADFLYEAPVPIIIKFLNLISDDVICEWSPEGNAKVHDGRCIWKM